MAKKVIGLAVALVLFVGLPLFIKLYSNNKISAGYNDGYQPDQPIPYSHELHAGKLKIDCKFCHTTTDISRHASVPSLNICMNCHMSVKLESPLVQKLQGHFMDDKPVVWQKVNLLPDHVKFNHSAHINAGKQCQECHGPVEEMPVVYQWSDLSMGWCVNCHRKPENNAPITCGTCHN
ncbi:MAG: cytochrome c3 family protein [Bdellovibrionaceae bacterium]|jgi:hypothetical protein|nr:cytochrome c3 family protein [Pseudobdellovibrionaceae bacterium]